jgi:hypothetical protein
MTYFPSCHKVSALKSISSFCHSTKYPLLLTVLKTVLSFNGKNTGNSRNGLISNFFSIPFSNLMSKRKSSVGIIDVILLIYLSASILNTGCPSTASFQSAINSSLRISIHQPLVLAYHSGNCLLIFYIPECLPLL